MFLNIEKEPRKVGLTINKDKTKYMHVRQRVGRDKNRDGQNITMDTNNIECVNQFQYLGAVITLDNHMDNKINNITHDEAG